MKAMSKKEFATEVFRATGEMQALVIKGLLESSGIPCLIKSNAAPSAHVFTVDGMGEFKIVVEESMAEEARKLIVGEDRA